jgi:6-phosphogluconolactonase
MRFTLILFLFPFYLAGQTSYLFIGTYTMNDNGSKGIYIYKFGSKKGSLQLVTSTENVVNPSFLEVSPDGKFIYACTETKSENEGTVSAFSFDKKKKEIKFINKQKAGGANPVYVALHKSGKWLVNGNYGGGSVTVFPVNENGSLSPYSQLIQHKGSSVNKERQEKAHVHSTVFSLSGNYLMVPDLGIDKVMSYKFSSGLEQPLVNDSVYAAALPGSGPRHFTFHPNGKFGYCIEELSGTISVYDSNNARFDSIQRISTYLKDSKPPYSSADIHVSPDGKFLYASNRLSENSIAVFSIHPNTGKLKYLTSQNTLGEVPRNFCIDPSGKFLLVANQGSGTVVVFKRDLKTGLLTETGTLIKIPSPSCLKMVVAKK